MDLEIPDVARLLNVSETTLEKWVGNRAIPSYEINGMHRFSRPEIEAWMMEQHGNHMPLFQKGSGSKGIFLYALFRALHKGGVYTDVPGDSKEQVIRNAMDMMADRFQLDSHVLSDLLLDRERQMPTALGNGIAIPHTRDFLLDTHYDLVAAVYPKKPLKYGALDGKPVDLLLFFFACDDQRHLHLLAKLAHLAADDKAVQFLKGRPDKDQLLPFIRDWEGQLSHAHVDATGLPDSI